MFHPNSCDNCKYYHWYCDTCDKWNCEIDCRSVHDCFEPYDTDDTECENN